MNQVTRILRAVEQGDLSAAAQLLPSIYDELRKLAAEDMANESPGRTFDASERAPGLPPPDDARATAPGDSSVRPTGEFTPGRVIAGRYRLLEILGEGGMGTVYRAEQSEPVRRQVALKLIRVGMDSRTVLARFDAERQALALMDHSNIARVYDGGTAESGRPFFVMELVRGVPITEYCDARRLPIKDRLELLASVCRAVQHAHQKGIIHRDLKPGNVLVTELDGRATPKVIDFGVAKATEFDLTDLSMGDTGAIVGTPTYMSPEQADPSSMDIDTRTDIYALGVILYELLAGSPPLDPSQLRRGALIEMLRMVREVEPPKPSTRVSAAEALPNIAASRGIEPSQLKRALAGDLDWIVMKALEKDRTRRYETANGLAADILRHLASEPVLAAPPSRSYRLRKFARKHRGGVIAAGLLVATLLAGIAGTAWGWHAARRSAARAERREEQAIDAVRRFADALSDEPELKNNAALEALRERLLKEPLASFRDLCDRLRADNDTRPESLNRLADAGRALGELTGAIGDKRDALIALGEAKAILQKLVDADPTATDLQRRLAGCHYSIGIVLVEAGKPAEAMKEFESTLTIAKKLAEASPSTTDSWNRLAVCHRSIGLKLRQIGKPVEAMRELKSARAIFQKLANDHPADTRFQDALAVTNSNIGLLLQDAEK